MTRVASPCQNPAVPWRRVNGSARRSIDAPNAASSAGIRVSEASMETSTTSAPPSPIDQTTLSRESISAPKPIATVPPDTSVATPADPTVAATASSTELGDGHAHGREAGQHREQAGHEASEDEEEEHERDRQRDALRSLQAPLGVDDEVVVDGREPADVRPGGAGMLDRLHPPPQLHVPGGVAARLHEQRGGPA